MDEKQEVILPGGNWDADGRPIARVRLTQLKDQRDKVVEADTDAVIPVIFLPGIMGTNLKSKITGDPVWRPPNLDGVGAVLGALGQMFVFLFRGAATRQRLLNPLTAEVDERGSIDAEDTIPDALARERGWGALMRSAYNPVMAEMHRKLNDVMSAGKLQQWWADEGARAPAEYGEVVGGNAALTMEQCRHAAHYRFEVWAGGYNWLQSNRNSAQDIVKRIDEVILPYYAKRGIRADKVMLVTHSMGGLVSRAVSHLENYGKLLGVSNGVMPATGAAATYHHCRAGYSGVSSIILGRNAGEVVAILGRAPGGLELLPTADYNEGKPWLQLGDSGPRIPIGGDPYNEIYLNTKWYGLVPEENTELLDPSAPEPAAAYAREEEDGPALSARALFQINIEGVAAFHSDIERKYHKPTFVHYGDDAKQLSWGSLAWSGGSMTGVDTMQPVSDNRNGKIKLQGATGVVKLEIADPTDPGDGTVPTCSGAAPKAEVAGCFRQGSFGAGQYAVKGKKGYEHQSSYNDERTRWATLYAAVRLAQTADWA